MQQLIFRTWREMEIIILQQLPLHNLLVKAKLNNIKWFIIL